MTISSEGNNKTSKPPQWASMEYINTEKINTNTLWKSIVQYIEPWCEAAYQHHLAPVVADWQLFLPYRFKSPQQQASCIMPHPDPTTIVFPLHTGFDSIPAFITSECRILRGHSDPLCWVRAWHTEKRDRIKKKAVSNRHCVRGSSLHTLVPQVFNHSGRWQQPALSVSITTDGTHDTNSQRVKMFQITSASSSMQSLRI